MTTLRTGPYTLGECRKSMGWYKNAVCMIDMHKNIENKIKGNILVESMQFTKLKNHLEVVEKHK